jgi:hypothetical protein
MVFIREVYPEHPIAFHRFSGADVETTRPAKSKMTDPLLKSGIQRLLAAEVPEAAEHWLARFEMHSHLDTRA